MLAIPKSLEEQNIFRCESYLWCSNVTWEPEVSAYEFAGSNLRRYNLGLSIRLWVASATIVKGGIEPPPQSPPEVAKEFDISIRRDGFWHPMQPNHLSEEEMGYVASVWCFPVGDEVCHFGEPINDYKNRIHTSLGPRKSEHKIHA
jgi:hypothetical protein